MFHVILGICICTEVLIFGKDFLLRVLQMPTRNHSIGVRLIILQGSYALVKTTEVALKLAP
ncbi:hypothetical protein EAG08_14040 [Chryseobacterium sp. 3008163]|nr:hypothetical protein EAG08_14040 [Chryseobacterium sp. 3008163]